VADRPLELAEELWDLLTADLEPSLGESVDLHARFVAINAVEARWKAMGAAVAGRHKQAALERYVRPPVTG
jgi:hypothetical protein